MPEEKPEGEPTRLVVQLTKGTSVGHYRIVEKIGAGGMGEVYLAEDTELNRQVALKFLSPHLCQDADCRTRFKREAQAAAKLNHPNIVTIHEVNEFNGRPFFAMEHIEGQSLRELIKAKELPIERVIELAIQICEGLHKAHQSGIVHRDVKPANILIDADGRAKILDFGLASVAGTDHLTKTGSTLGTIGYMSPEQAKGEEVDQRSDIFSLGVVLYEMITSKSPFKTDNDAATLRNIIDHEPEPLARYKVDVPAELQRIVSKALAKDTDLRYQHADEMLADLRAILQMANPAARSKKPTRNLLLAGGGILIIAAVVFGYFQLLPKPASGTLKSIAVLPFEDMSPQKDQEYFCDGMTEELIGRLSNIRDLRVPSRTSVFLFKGRTLDIREIGDKLKVQTVLEGSVRKAGNQLRITTQLINVADGYHIWSETFDRELKDVFAIQDEIATAIADRLKFTPLGEEKAKLVKRPTANVETYNLYLLGEYFFYKYNKGSFDKSLAYFEQAVAKDPSFALGYVGQALCHIDLYIDGFVHYKDSYPQAKAAVTKALELDGNLGKAHAALGRIKLFFEWDMAGAEREFKRAIEISPDNIECLNSYGLYLTIAGKCDEAIAVFMRVVDLDPASPAAIFTLGSWGYYSAGRFDEGIVENKKALSLDPGFENSLWSMAQLYALAGMHSTAVSSADSLMAAHLTLENSPYALLTLAWVYAVSGREESARDILRQAMDYRTSKYLDAYLMALVYAGLGDRDKAFEWLTKGYEERASQMIFIKMDPALVDLRADPRFSDLLREMKLEQ
jgi:eukaryotic-like serine/threonine-protein kinase